MADVAPVIVSTSHTPAALAETLPILGAPLSSTSTSPPPQQLSPPARNQAPGIPDRRKSLRPGKGAAARRSSGLSRSVSVASMASELRVKDPDDDDGSNKPDDEFTDASTHPVSTVHQTETAEEEAKDQDTSAVAGAEIETAGDGDGNDQVNKAAARMSFVPDAVDSITVGNATASSPAHSRQSTLETGPDLANTAVATPSPPRPQPLSMHSTLPPGKVSPRQRSPVRSVQGLSGEHLIVSPPPPSTIDRAHALEQREIVDHLSSPPQREGLARKASSGFGALLGRMGSIRKTTMSPPTSRQGSRYGVERRGTAASLPSVESNVLPTIHCSTKPSLQDQFTSLRRQEESNAHEANVLLEQNEDARSERTRSEAGSRPPSSPVDRPSSATAMKSPPLNPSLPPGTASGMSAGPASDPQDVNWDLWQQLVYDGPTAVSRSSGKELERAIASGIPPAIRGVVWQILAESKNEELEHVYRTLKMRGTESEHRPSLTSRPGSTAGINGNAAEKEAVTSDGSSEHSEHSTSANSGAGSPPTSISVESSGPELRTKLMEEKQKREAAALQKLEKAIRRDMGSRTSYSKYTQSAGLQDGLFGVCKAYALFDEGVGYAQGINFIAMPLLFNMSEEEAFTLLVRLMSKYDLRSMFTSDMAGLHLRLYQYERLLEEREPAVYCHLRRRHVSPQLYATQWFLTLFAYRFPLQLVLRIYDMILSEGLTAILKFGIVLMQRNREALLEMKDMSQLTNFLKEKLFDVYIDKSPSASSLLDSGFFGSVTGGADKELYRADEMVRDACSVKISDEMLSRYTVDWQESQREERERDQELETLRTTNIALATQARSLEDRVQQSDAEHVNMAQDLVKWKVENDTLHDQNEALKVQVTELQKLIDVQPAEVEAKLKEEMDRIMQRNIEVQNENRAVKEEMGEMEHELVHAKMAHAQTQADFESIKQKWSNVQALLNEKS